MVTSQIRAVPSSEPVATFHGSLQDTGIILRCCLAVGVMVLQGTHRGLKAVLKTRDSCPTKFPTLSSSHAGEDPPRSCAGSTSEDCRSVMTMSIYRACKPPHRGPARLE